MRVLLELKVLIPRHEIVDRVPGDRVVKTSFSNQSAGNFGRATEQDRVLLLCQSKLYTVFFSSQIGHSASFLRIFARILFLSLQEAGLE